MDFNSIIQVVIAIIAVAGFVFAVYIGSRLKVDDNSILAPMFIVGLLLAVASVIALVIGVSYIVSVGLLIGAMLIGMSIGLNTKREG